MPYNLRAYRMPTQPYRTISRFLTTRLTGALSSPFIPSVMRTTTAESPPRSSLAEDIMQMLNGSNSATMDASTSLLGRTLMRNPIPPTFTSIPHIPTRQPNRSCAGSIMCSSAPPLLSTPYTKPYQISTIGMWSLRSNATTAMTTTITASPPSSTRLPLSSPSSRIPSTPLNTELRQPAFQLSFPTSRDEPSHMLNEDDAPMEAMMVMDQELHSRAEGDVIASYRWFKVRAIGGWKCKSPGD